MVLSKFAKETFLYSRRGYLELRHPAYDLRIKALLMLYGGTLFRPYCTIVEKK